MPRPKKTTLVSFQHAFDGIWHVVVTQRRMRVHLILAALVVAAGAAVRLSREQWFVVYVAIAMVLIVDLMDASVDACVKLFTEKYRPAHNHARCVTDAACLVADAMAAGMLAVIFLSSPL